MEDLAQDAPRDAPGQLPYAKKSHTVDEREIARKCDRKSSMKTPAEIRNAEISELAVVVGLLLTRKHLARSTNSS